MKRNAAAIMLCALAAVLCGLGSAWAVTYAYIPSYTDNSVVRVNTSEQTYDSVVFDDEPCSPYGAAVTPNGRFVVITCTDEDAVTALTNANFDDGTAPGTAAVGNEPRGVAIDPRGSFAFVANFGDDTVSIINIDTTTVAETVDVGDGPIGVAAIHQASESRIKVYVSNFNAGTVSVIIQNGAEFVVETISAVGNNPVGVAATPDGKHIYVANYNNGLIGSVRVIRTEDDTIIGTIQVGRGPWGVAVGAKGQYAFVSNSNNAANSITLIRTSDHSARGTLTNVGALPHGLAAPKNGDFAYVINQAGDNPIGRIELNAINGTATVELIAQHTTHTISGAFALGTFIGGTPPARPTDLTVAAGGDDAELTWTDNSTDEAGFKIERRQVRASQIGEAAYEEIGEADENATEFTDRTAIGGNSYQYRIRAYNEAADSAYVTGTETVTPESDSFSWCFIGTLLH
jgi:YVTN family beta-propeller protein